MDKIGEEGRGVISSFLRPHGIGMDFSQLILLKTLKSSAWLCASPFFKHFFFLMLLGVLFFFSFMESIGKKKTQHPKKRATGLCWPWPFEQLGTRKRQASEPACTVGGPELPAPGRRQQLCLGHRQLTACPGR